MITNDRTPIKEGEGIVKKNGTIVESEEEEDILDRPGIISKAANHGNAARVLDIALDFPSEATPTFCYDCNLPLESPGIASKFNCCVNEKKLAVAGYGIYLYFFFILYLIANFIGIIGMIAGPYIYISETYSSELFDYCTEFYNNVSTPIGQETSNKRCENFAAHTSFDSTNFDWLNRWSGESMIMYAQLIEEIKGTNERDSLVANFNLISFIGLLVLWVVNMLYIMLSSALVNEIDFNEETPSDYTIMVSDIPHDYLIEQQVRDYLKNEPDTLHEINLTYKLTDLNQIKEDLVDLKHEKESANKQGKGPGDIYTKIKWYCCKKKCNYDDLIGEIKQAQIRKRDEEDNRGDTFNGVAFITFNNQEEQEEYCKRFPNSFLSKLFINTGSRLGIICCGRCLSDERKARWRRKVQIDISKAPEPQDIIWEHLEFHFLSRLGRSCVGYSVSLFCIAISFGFVLLFDWIQNLSSEEFQSNQALSYGMSFLIGFVLDFINGIVASILSNMAMWEKPWTYTSNFLSLSIKTTFFTFINTAIVPLISNIIYNGVNDQQNLVNNMFMTFLTTTCMTPIMSFLSIDFGKAKLSQWLGEYFASKDNKITRISFLKNYFGFHDKSQKELNELYENPDMEISSKYSDISMAFLLTCFYLPIFPLGAIISCIGAILTYFAEKFKLTMVYKKPIMINESICFFYIDHFVFAFFVYSIGHWIFCNNILSNNFYEYFNIIFYGILVLIPYKKALRFDLSGAIENTNDVTYDDAFFNFQYDYIRLNPKTQTRGIAEYLLKLKTMKIINERVYMECMEQLNKINIRALYHAMRNQGHKKNDKGEELNTKNLDVMKHDNINLFLGNLNIAANHEKYYDIPKLENDKKIGQMLLFRSKTNNHNSNTDFIHSCLQVPNKDNNPQPIQLQNGNQPINAIVLNVNPPEAPQAEPDAFDFDALPDFI